MKLLWICGLPFEVQQQALDGQDFGAHSAWSWVMGHLPPPEGVELHIACRTSRHTKPLEFDYRGAHFHLIPVKTRARILCLFQFDWWYFHALAKRLQPELIHGWGTEDAYAHIALRLAPGHHLIQVQGNVNTYRRRVKMPRLTWLAALSERMALARARHVVAENDYSLNSARPMIQTPSAHVVEHPIRKDFLTATPSAGIGKQIIFVGAIDDRKGIWDALEAFGASAAIDWKLHIIGNGPRQPLAELKRRIATGGFAGRVQHSAQLDSARIVTEMQRSSLFLLPTKIDTGPTALKEAMAMGLWPICYDNSGPANYIRKFQYGTLVEDLNPAALTRALQTAIAEREWEAGQQRAKIVEQIRPHFSRERIWVDLLKVYRHVCDESTRLHEKHF